MKKSFLTAIVAVLATTSMAVAAPQFGIGAFSAGTNGTNVPGTNIQARSAIFPGLYITDDMYTVTLGLGTTDNGATAPNAEAITTISLDVNYKLALNSVTAATFGIGYTTISGDLGGIDVNGTQTQAEIDTATILDLNVGLERDLGNNLLFVGVLNVYSTQTVDTTVGSTTATTVDAASQTFSGGKVGLVYLF